MQRRIRKTLASDFDESGKAITYHSKPPAPQFSVEEQERIERDIIAYRNHKYQVLQNKSKTLGGNRT